jgi:hypothetical protein
VSRTHVTEYRLETDAGGGLVLGVTVIRVPDPYRAPSQPDVEDVPPDFREALRRWVDGAR